MREADIQQILRNRLSAGIITPNSLLYGWEADLLLIRPNLIVWEFEIKISKADYLREFKQKAWKHSVLQGEKVFPVDNRRPNRYFFVAPAGIIPDVPKYCGLIEIKEENDYKSMNILKKAPLLHNKRIEPKQLYQIASSLEFKYWNRNGTNGNIIYIRFGLPPESGRSHNYLFKKDEEGISVYEAIERGRKVRVIMPSHTGSACVTLSGCFQRPIYEVSGNRIGTGSDGEPLLGDCQIVREIEKEVETDPIWLT